MNKTFTIQERKQKYKHIIQLISEGHTTQSAGKIVGYSQPHISRLLQKKWFKKRLASVDELITGNVKNALVKRATGQRIVKEYQQVDKFGDIHDLEETTEIPGDVKAQLAWLQAKDKTGGWIQDTHTTNIQINQSLQGISTNDLLLTLKSGAQAIEGTGGGVGPGSVLAVSSPQDHSEQLILNSEQLKTDSNGQLNEKLEPLSIDFKHPLRTFRTYRDQLEGSQDSPVEGPLENVGIDDVPDET